MRTTIALVLAVLMSASLGGVAVAEPGGNDHRAASIAQFPRDVRPLLQDLPQRLIDLLWEVRQAGPNHIVWQDSGTELHEGQERAYLREWAEITGWSVNAVSFGGGANNELERQVKAGEVEWDVSEVGSNEAAQRMARDGLFETLDLRYFPVGRLTDEVLVARRWMPLITYGTVLLYNTEAYRPGRRPRKLSDLWDLDRFPGTRCLYDGARYGWNFEYALMADGVPFDRVYTVLRAKGGLQRAFAKLNEIKDDTLFWITGAESVQFILDGQCDMGTTWNGRPFLRLVDEPELPLGAAWNGALLDGDPFVIPRGAPHPDAALSAMAYAMRPRNQCDLMNELGYGVPMRDQPFPKCLTPRGREFGAHAGQDVEGPPSPVFWARNGRRMNNAWARWKTR